MTVTYIDLGLHSVGDYWTEMVIPSVKEFHANPSRLTAFQAAHSLWHLHDWEWHQRNPGQNSSGPAFDTYRSNLLASCPELGWLRDIADGGKHRGLGRTATVLSAADDWMPLGNMTVGGTGGFKGIVTLEMRDGSKQDVGAALVKVVGFWQKESGTKNLATP